MKIVFFGSSDFAVPSLTKLNKSYGIAAVVSRSEKPKGRRLLKGHSPVKIKAEELGIKIFSIDELSVAQAEEILKGFRADMFVVIAYGRILTREILSIPRFYSIGLHASLLPKYRGASPINHAILNAEKKTGVTAFKLDKKMDAGDIILRREVDILDSDNAETLSFKLAETGADLIVEAVKATEDNNVRFIKQDEREATFTSKLKKEDGAIDWLKDAVSIHNKVRAFYGWPGAFSKLNGRAIKVLATEVADTQGNVARPGEIIKVESAGIYVACKGGVIRIKQLQAEGGRAMSVSDYIIGHKVLVGDFFL